MQGVESAGDAELEAETADGALLRLNLSALASLLKKAVGAGDEEQAFLRIRLAPAGGQTAELLTNKAREAGASVTEIPLVASFLLESGGSVKALEFGSAQELAAVWKLKSGIDPKQAVVVSYDTTNGSLRIVSVPVSLQDGAAWISIPAQTSEALAVLVIRKSFADLKDHWAQADVELLASRLLIDGESADKFKPDKAITRSQFTALLVRALGLAGTGAKAGAFADVAGTEWFAPQHRCGGSGRVRERLQ